MRRSRARDAAHRGRRDPAETPTLPGPPRRAAQAVSPWPCERRDMIMADASDATAFAGRHEHGRDVRPPWGMMWRSARDATVLSGLGAVTAASIRWRSRAHPPRHAIATTPGPADACRGPAWPTWAGPTHAPRRPRRF